MTSKEEMSSTTDPVEAALRRRAASALPVPAGAGEFWTALRNWAGVIGLLLIQYLDRRSRAGRLSLLVMIAEPFLLIAMLYLIRAVFRGGIAQYGPSLLLFLVSGMLPFYICLRPLLAVRTSQLKTARPLPRITSMDRFIADIVGSTLIWLLAMLIVFMGLYFSGIDQARPKSIGQCLIALFLLVLFGAGFGLLNASIARFVPIWLTIIGYSMRGLVFFSGVFHISDMYRPGLREWLVWNPMMHGIDWFRLGLYGTYPVRLMDQSYLVKSAIVFLFLGIIADRASLRRGGR